MTDIVNVIINIITTIIVALLAFENLKLRSEKKKISANFIQATIDNGVLYEKFNELVSEKEKSKLEQSDGFIKFISESRDQAFNYIEKTQDEIKKFSDKVEPQVKYIETYGQAYTLEPYSEMLKTIAEAYRELMQVLPNEEK
jgi:hypothetical protein